LEAGAGSGRSAQRTDGSVDEILAGSYDDAAALGRSGRRPKARRYRLTATLRGWTGPSNVVAAADALLLVVEPRPENQECVS
jgi:hypothetical protein